MLILLPGFINYRSYLLGSLARLGATSLYRLIDYYRLDACRQHQGPHEASARRPGGRMDAADQLLQPAAAWSGCGWPRQLPESQPAC